MKGMTRSRISSWYQNLESPGFCHGLAIRQGHFQNRTEKLNVPVSTTAGLCNKSGSHCPWCACRRGTSGNPVKHHRSDMRWSGANCCDQRVRARVNAKCLEGTMTGKFDVIAIGTGSAASAVAARCREAGWQVAIVDSSPFGGTCALRGCDPKKVLVGAAEAVDWARRMKGKGIQAARLQIDWPELMRFKRSFSEPVPKRREDGFAKAGIAAFHGRARFAGPTTIQVGEETLAGRYVVIAAGEAPADLKIPGAEHLTTSDQFLELNELPRRILFIGGGYIAFEFAHVAARVGSQVTILHRGPRPLALFDPDLVDQLVERTRELGIDVHLGTEAIGIEKSSDELMVRALVSGETVTFQTEMVVHAAGRVPEINRSEER